MQGVPACQVVLTGDWGAVKNQLTSYWEGVETAASPLGPWRFRCFGASGRVRLLREIGWARMERIDGASRGRKEHLPCVLSGN